MNSDASTSDASTSDASTSDASTSDASTANHAPVKQTMRFEVGCFTIGGIVALALLAILAAFLWGRDQEPETVTVRETPNVVVAVQNLARLETAAYHMERVIDIKDRQESLFGLVSAEDAVLLIAAGDVTAGVDLSKVTQVDIEVDETSRRARIVLPAPEVLITRLDNERTFVHTRRTDVLAKRNETLETRARQEAERSLRDAALHSGIIALARRNAEHVIRTLIQSLGYQDVTIAWQDRPSPTSTTTPKPLLPPKQ